jgi:hypothetical protein
MRDSPTRLQSRVLFDCKRKESAMRFRKSATKTEMVLDPLEVDKEEQLVKDENEPMSAEHEELGEAK